MLLPGLCREAARSIGERVRRGVTDSTKSARGYAPVTISLGISEAGPNYEFQGLLRRADDALYRAKHHGRNIVCD